MKNKIKQYLLVTSMCVGLTACSSFFEPIPGVQFGLGETFASKQRMEEHLNNIYSHVREMTDAIHPNTYGGISTEASLDGTNRWDKTYVEWTNGSFSSTSAQASEYLSKYYQAIAKVSTFIQNMDKCTEAAASTRRKWKLKVRALRAYCYSELLRLYSSIPLIGEDPISSGISLEELTKERNSVDGCVNFIATGLQSAIDSGDLLQGTGKVDLGHMDIAAYTTLEVKLYLYWASPLFNGNTDQAPVKNKDGKRLFPQTEGSSKRTQVRDAYERSMTFATRQEYRLTEAYTNGKLDPYTLCGTVGELFITTREVVDESIFVKPRGLYDYTYWVCPKSTDFQDTDVTDGSGYYTTQETVDLFSTKGGLTIEEDPGYDKFEGTPGTNNFTSGRYYSPNNPFRLCFDINKSEVLKQWRDYEPRSYVNITYNGSIQLNKGRYNEEMRTDLTDGANGTCGKSKASGDCPDPGYLIRWGTKASNNNGLEHLSSVLRPVDMYLGHAEALYMCSDLDSALTYLNKIRVRAGIPEYTFTAAVGKITCPKTQTDLPNRIRRERLVELVFEWNHCFDAHCWKVAEGQNDLEHWVYPVYRTGSRGGKIYGMNVDKDYPAFFERISFETRVAFTKKQYFIPTPYDGLRRIPLLVQNLGW